MAELVGGALLSALFPYLLQKLDGVVADFFKRRKLDEQLLKKLKTFMLSVQGLLEDAEEKQITKSAVKTWLDDLRDVMYEADDFLDEICYDAMQLEMEAGAPETSKRRGKKFVSSLNPFKKGKKEKPAKLEEILGRLQDLVGQKDVLGLIEVIGEKPSTHKIPTTPLVDESCVYGRDADKEEIKKLLLSADLADASKVAVIPIVGMGGLGKTTLAQLVFNEVEEGQFDLKAWVCVSEEYNVEKVTRDILQEFTKQSSEASNTLHQLQNQLQEKLKEKRYLLVLDDVWEHRWADSWDILQRPLTCGGRGSRIIVTTRDREVARIMHAEPYGLEILSREDSGKLLAKHALGCENYSCVDSDELQEVFEELVRKCSGLPLASKMIGRLLYRKDAKYWKKIAKSNLWNLPKDAKILPALRLSYHHLPSHLKQFFAYCAIIPKDCSFKKEEIVRLWMAEGFLGRPKEDVNMEELGHDYFDDLVSRSFFQQQHEDDGQYFNMHDLINDLAKSVSGEFCCTFESEEACNIMERARHVSCWRRDGYRLSKKFKAIGGAKSLRTFLPFPVRCDYRGEVSGFDNEVLCELLSTHKCLRVLSVSGYSNIDELPDSIGQMKHLRYLDLSGTSIKRLPQVVGILHNLETLILEKCRNLTILPDSIGNLSHLYCLNIDGTAITMLPDSVNRLLELQTFILGKLQVMPPQVGKLGKLQLLSHFFVGRESGCGVKELGHLNLLGGKLSICNLQNIINAEDALEARLKDKKNLTELVLEWDSSDEIAESFNVLENLKPHRKLERLSVHGYGATRFPNWMVDSSFPNMVELKITDCNNFTSLPSLGQLPSLKKLFIKGFRRIVIVGPEFYGSCPSTKKPFGSLEELYFEDMPEWCEWIPYREVESNESGRPFPLLRELIITGCPNLRCQQIVRSLPRPRPDTLFSMRLEDDSRHVSIQKEQYGSRRYGLRIDRYHSTDPVVELIHHPVFVPSAWEEISICRWDSLDCLSSSVLDFARGIGAPNLKRLDVEDCSNLKSLPEDMHSLAPSLEKLDIVKCPKLDSFPEGGSLTSLKYLYIGDCDKLVSRRFPKEAVLSSTLASLHLYDLRNLTTWDSKGLEGLNSLKEIQIVNCPSIESLPEGGLLPKLENLYIQGCKTLVANRLQWNLQSFPSLLWFGIGRCDDLDSFPEEMLLPSTLASLGIYTFGNLTSLNYNGLQQLTSLKELSIYNCSKLQSLPEEGLPSSLSSLSINECPLLRQRCARGTGEDWPKISHIPKVTIDYRQIVKC